jgi:hypothetical protein
MRSSDNDPEGMKEAKLPRRDWILLPLLSLLTICMLAALAELLARHIYPDVVSSLHLTGCTVHNDSPNGARAVPSSVCWEKLPEGH